ncbi:MAG: sulfite exporter TauE/SafE family protein [Burkholderiales bacterium]|nr:sulfite exporter TauE/SafE family protein [Burkholderiales bacterium]MDE2076616.1 sulfite exporter TauE/SafE family protein [Burkholderiales bacterium]MDE2432188.1 sulfite exporter TauE/SafE family protein [Burkholderiales bacterium]
MQLDWTAIAAGAGVGSIVGLTGVGGGSLMTPLLISVFHLDKAVAIGTDLWFAGLTKVSGAVAHHHQGHVDYHITRKLLYGSIPASILTTLFMHLQGITKSGQSLLAYALGIALLLTALTVAFRPFWLKVGIWLERWVTRERRPYLTVACGVILGVLVSLSSIGAGALGATMILLLYPRLDVRRLVGSDIAHAVPLTIVAGIGHASLGNVDWMLLTELLIGSLPAIWIAAKLTKHLPDTITRMALCGCLVLAANKVLMSA